MAVRPVTVQPLRKAFFHYVVQVHKRSMMMLVAFLFLCAAYILDGATTWLFGTDKPGLLRLLAGLLALVFAVLTIVVSVRDGQWNTSLNRAQKEVEKMIDALTATPPGDDDQPAGDTGEERVGQ